MSADFGRILTLLRQEKGLTQRKAAVQLEVSQALLSHYENGAREPGFDFLIKAADFYNVTVDYLLGRTMSRERMNIELIPDAASAKSNTLDGGVRTTLQRKIITNTITMIFDLVSRSGKQEISDTASKYFVLSVYKLFRYIYMMNPKEYESLFSVPTHSFAELSDIELKRCEIKLKQFIRENDGEVPDMSYEKLISEYPALHQSTMMLLHMASELLSDETTENKAEEKNKKI